MPRKTVRPGSGARVSSRIFFRIKKSTTRKRKGQIVSEAYAKRYPHLVKKEKWLYIHTLRVGTDQKTGKDWERWAITERAKLTETEKIMPVTSFHDRDVRHTLGKYKVFQKLWENNRGEIRITVNGVSDGKRIKEVIHTGFLKKAWEPLHNGKEKFKDHLVGVILSNLKRRGLRLSNSKESAQRIARLIRKRDDLIESISMVQDPQKMGGMMEQLRWVKKAIPQQQKAKQLTKANIRIEKMVS